MLKNQITHWSPASHFSYHSVQINDKRRENFQPIVCSQRSFFVVILYASFARSSISSITLYECSGYLRNVWVPRERPWGSPHRVWPVWSMLPSTLRQCQGKKHLIHLLLFCQKLKRNPWRRRCDISQITVDKKLCKNLSQKIVDKNYCCSLS